MDETVYMKYAQLKKDMYDALLLLKEVSESQAIEDQRLKSVNLLLKGEEIGLFISATESSSIIADI